MKKYDFYYYFYNKKLCKMYKKEFIKRRVKEIESGKKDLILERFRAGLVIERKINGKK